MTTGLRGLLKGKQKTLERPKMRARPTPNPKLHEKVCCPSGYCQLGPMWTMQGPMHA